MIGACILHNYCFEQVLSIQDTQTTDQTYWCHLMQWIYFFICAFSFSQTNKQTKKPLLSQFNRFYVLPSLHEPKYTFTGRFKNWHHSFIRQVHRYMHILSKCASLNLYRYSMGPLIWQPWDRPMSGFQITAKKLTPVN